MRFVIKKIQMIVIIFTLLLASCMHSNNFTSMQTRLSMNGYKYIGSCSPFNGYPYLNTLQLYLNNNKIIIINNRDYSSIYKTIQLESKPISHKFFTWNTVKNEGKYESNLLTVSDKNGTISLNCYILDFAAFKLIPKWEIPLPYNCDIVSPISSDVTIFGYEDRILLQSKDKMHVVDISSDRKTKIYDYDKPVYVSNFFYIYDGIKLYDIRNKTSFDIDILGSVDKTIIGKAFYRSGNLFIYNGNAIYSIIFKGNKLSKIIDINDVLSVHMDIHDMTFVTTSQGLFSYNEQKNELMPVSTMPYVWVDNLCFNETCVFCSDLYVCNVEGLLYSLIIIREESLGIIDYKYEAISGRYIDYFTDMEKGDLKLFILTDKGISKTDVSYIYKYKGDRY